MKPPLSDSSNLVAASEIRPAGLWFHRNSDHDPLVRALRNPIASVRAARASMALLPWRYFLNFGQHGIFKQPTKCFVSLQKSV